MPGDGRDEPPAAWDAGGAEPSSSVSTYRPRRIAQRQRHGARGHDPEALPGRRRHSRGQPERRGPQRDVSRIRHTTQLDSDHARPTAPLFRAANKTVRTK